MRTVVQHECQICGARYENEHEAILCEGKGFSKNFEVGQIVLAAKSFGWYDGDKAWVSNPEVSRQRPCPNGSSNCFGSCCCFRFYYVITHIDGHDRDGHRPQYHLFTLAMSEKGYRSGLTYDEGHCAPRLVTYPPKEVVESSRALLGKKARCLL